MKGSNRRLASRSQGKALRSIAILVAVFLVGAAFAYRFLFPRPGEEAIRLIPESALMVVTLDTKPSTRQIAVFEKIGAALKREGLDQRVEQMLAEAFEKSPVVAELRPHISQDFAYALLEMPAGKEMDGSLMFLALTDPAGAMAALRKHAASAREQGLEVFRFKSAPGVVVGVIEPYIVIASDPSLLAKVVQTRDSGKCVAALPEYQAARAELPEDANFMFFGSPRGIAKMGEMAKEMGVNPTGGAKWLAVSATVREDGLVFDMRYPFDPKTTPGIAEFGKIAPLQMATLGKLPEGAYGLMGYSQPGKYWSYIKQSMSQTAELEKAIREGVAAFEKETGIGVERDLLPALDGGFWLAVYPDGEDKDSAVDVLLLLDDSNGASPAALADKVRAELAKAYGRDPVSFQRTERKNAVVYAIDAGTEKKLRNDVGGASGLRSSGGPDMTSFRRQMIADMKKQSLQMPAESRREYEKMIRQMEQDLARSSASGGAVTADLAAPNAQEYLKDKTLIHAQIGNSLLIASSRRMLERALDAWNDKAPSLLDQDAYKGMMRLAEPNSQNVMMVNLAAIMKRLEPMIADGMKGSSTTIAAGDIAGIFGPETTGMVMSGRFDGATSTGSFFLPLDYEKMIGMIGDAVRDLGVRRPGQSITLQ